MDRTANLNYGTNYGVRLLRRLFEDGHFIFSSEEAGSAAAHASIPQTYVRELLTHLTQGGWIHRLRRGLYVGTGGLPGDVRVHPFAIATQMITPSAISRWSAMQHHGLTEQIPLSVTATTPRKVYIPHPEKKDDEGNRPTQTREVLGVRYDYVSVDPRHFFGIEMVWVDQTFQIPITDRERTMLDGFVDPRDFGGLPEVLGILEEHLQEIDVEKLVGYAVRYEKASVAKRLGWALEQLEVHEDILAPLMEVPVTGFRVLDPTRPHRGPCDRRWMIQNNLAAEGPQ